MNVKELHGQGHSMRAVARLTGHARTTVERALHPERQKPPRKRRPCHSASLMKSADQHSFICLLAAKGSGLRDGSRCLPLRRLLSRRAR